MKREGFGGMAVVLLTAVGLTGCTTTEKSATNPSHPGPAIGGAVGSAAGAVAGNVAGAVVAGAQGAGNAFQAPFTNERRVIRTWRTEKTADGRTIQVPVDIEVDKDGRPITK